MTQSETLGAKYWFFALLALAPALRLYSLVAENSLWGVNHPAFSSWIWSAAVSALVISGLALVLRMNCSERFWEFAASAGGRLTLSASALLLFYFASADSHLFGSGLEQVGNLSQRAVPFVDQYAAGATKLHWTVYQLTSGITGRALNDSSLAVRAVAALSGAITVFLWLHITTLLTPSAAKRSLIAGFMALTGATLLFFGNGAFFAPAALIVTLFIWLALRLLQSDSKSNRILYLISLVVVVALGFWYQMQLALLAPALVFVIGLGFSRESKGERLFGILGILSLAGLLYLIYQQSANDLWVAARLMHLSDKPPEFGYGIFSLDRIVDLSNSALALWPLAPLLVWLIVRYSWSERCDHVVGFLGMLSLSSVTWFLISDFPGGAAREIVTLAPFAIPPAALAGYLLSKRVDVSVRFLGDQSHKIISAITIWSLLMVAPIHLFGDNTQAYLDSALKDRAGRYRSAMVGFRDHYFFTKEFAKADRWERLMDTKSSESLDMSTVQEQLLRGQVTPGVNRAEYLVATHPYWEEPRGALASGLRALGQRDRALEEIEKALQLRPPYAIHIVIEGDIHRDSRRYGEALESYKRALDYDPYSALARSRLALLYAGLEDYETALKHAYLLYEDSPIDPYSYLIVAMAATREGDFRRALDYMTMVTPYAAGLPERDLIDQLLRQLRQAVQTP
jgi:tetratricopeptide (TPR) repeat protein